MGRSTSWTSATLLIPKPPVWALVLEKEAELKISKFILELLRYLEIRLGDVMGVCINLGSQEFPVWGPDSEVPGAFDASDLLGNHPARNLLRGGRGAP